MVARWMFLIGFFELLIACAIDLWVLRMQLQQFRWKSDLQPLKRLLLGAVAFLILASAPLMLVYADAIWFHLNGKWIIYAAVLSNATAKLVVAIMLILIYRFKGSVG